MYLVKFTRNGRIKCYIGILNECKHYIFTSRWKHLLGHYIYHIASWIYYLGSRIQNEWNALQMGTTKLYVSIIVNVFSIASEAATVHLSGNSSITSKVKQSTSVGSISSLGSQHSLLHMTCFEWSHLPCMLINIVLVKLITVIFHL